MILVVGISVGAHVCLIDFMTNLVRSGAKVWFFQTVFSQSLNLLLPLYTRFLKSLGFQEQILDKKIRNAIFSLLIMKKEICVRNGSEWFDTYHDFVFVFNVTEAHSTHFIILLVMQRMAKNLHNESFASLICLLRNSNIVWRSFRIRFERIHLDRCRLTLIFFVATKCNYSLGALT